MKKILICLTALVLVFSVGCAKKEESGLAFKRDYESVNGKENSHGKLHRELDIPEDNVFEVSSATEIVKKIENKDTFYVYFGSKLCPWCRSTIVKANEVAKAKGVSKIYYVDIWDNDGNEILRDKYTLDDKNKPVLDKEGTKEYKKFLEVFDSLLSDYTLTDKDGKTIQVGEKRIYAPNFIYIEKGVAKKLVTGLSDKLKDSRDELTKEILDDEEKIYNGFFTEVCRDAC